MVAYEHCIIHVPDAYYENEPQGFETVPYLAYLTYDAVFSESNSSYAKSEPCASVLLKIIIKYQNVVK